MYTIYVEDKPIVLTQTVEKETTFKNFLLKTVNIYSIIKQLNTRTLEGVHLIHNKKEKLLPEFLKLLPNVVAAGGKVYNSKNEILFIFRNNKWDLPKGKIENNERVEETAIREVEEETGVGNLAITNTLPSTYHIFKRQGTYKIKITHWFEMRTNFDGLLQPQENEGITRVAWLNANATKVALKNSYANIKTLIPLPSHSS